MVPSPISVDLDAATYSIDLHDFDDTTRVQFTSKGNIERAKACITHLLIEGPFTHLPSFIDELPNLKRVILGSHEIDVILEESIHRFESLKHLKILGLGNHVKSGTDLKRPIPEVISRLDGIEELAMSVASPSLLPRCLPQMSKLACLRIYGTIQEFPDVILSVRSLKQLYIANVGMERFPAPMADGSPARSELVALEKLDISQNPITELPGWLFPGDKMRELNAAGTRITALSGDIGRWGTNLGVLDVSDSDLDALPEGIGACKKLRDLRAIRTKIRALPASIGECTNLENLDLSYTPLESLPVEIGNCHGLKVLNLAHTKVTDVPASIGECTNLVELNLSWTNVKTLPEEVAYCRNLRRVYHQHLRRSTVPPVVWKQPTISFIQLPKRD